MAKPIVYIETSVVGYLTSRPSADPLVLSRQMLTREWWDADRRAFDARVSRLVQSECGAGDAGAAAERLERLRGLPVLPEPPGLDGLAAAIVEAGPLPPRAHDDARHLATAVLARVDYLLTWNFAHLANDVIAPRVAAMLADCGHKPCIITDPQRLRAPRRIADADDD